MPEKEIKTPFIPSQLDDAGLDPFEFRIFGRISRRGKCDERVQSMASTCGMGHHKVRDALKVLVEARMVSRTERSGQSNVYQARHPRDWLPVEPARKRALEDAPPSGSGRGEPLPDEEGGPLPDQEGPSGSGRGGVPDMEGGPLPDEEGAYKGTPTKGTPTKGPSSQQQHSQTDTRAPTRERAREAESRDVVVDSIYEIGEGLGFSRDEKNTAFKLRGAGISSTRAACQLIDEHGVETALRQLRHLNLLQARGNPPDNPGGFLRKAIEEDYSLPGQQQNRPKRRRPAPPPRKRPTSGDGQAGPAPKPAPENVSDESTAQDLAAQAFANIEAASAEKRSRQAHRKKQRRQAKRARFVGGLRAGDFDLVATADPNATKPFRPQL